MAESLDELTQLSVALSALKTMDRDGQVRALQYLNDRLAYEYQKAIAAREASARIRITDRSPPTTRDTQL